MITARVYQPKYRPTTYHLHHPTASVQSIASRHQQQRPGDCRGPPSGCDERVRRGGGGTGEEHRPHLPGGARDARGGAVPCDAHEAAQHATDLQSPAEDDQGRAQDQ